MAMMALKAGSSTTGMAGAPAWARSFARNLTTSCAADAVSALAAVAVIAIEAQKIRAAAVLVAISRLMVLMVPLHSLGEPSIAIPMWAVT